MLEDRKTAGQEMDIKTIRRMIQSQFGRPNVVGSFMFCRPSNHPFFQYSTIPFFRHSARSAGFTMIELLVVLGIILVMIGVAVTSLSGSGTPKQQLRKEARALNGLFKEARQSAMERKLKVDVYVTPEARMVCAVEAGYARKLLAENSDIFSDGVSLKEFVPETNRFFKIIMFPEEIAIEAFTLNDIEPETIGEEALFEPAPQADVINEASKPSSPVFGFTNLGGSSGGGVSVVRDGLRIDIACDLLTGQPGIVQRRGAQ